MKRYIFPFFIMMLAINSATVFSSDLAKEKRWADQVVDGIIVGDAVWLEAEGNKFLGIYTEHSTATARGAAIVIHGTGAHPNWPDVVQPIRSELPDHGWATLSLQMPILPNDATDNDYAPLFEEIAPRMEAGIAFLKQQGISNIVVIGHSMGATMAAYYLANTPAADVQALVAVGISGILFTNPKKNYLASLKKLSMPILDIYGSNDLESVMETAKQKAQVAAKAGNKNYRQVKIIGSNHFHHGLESDLMRRVKSWLSNYGGKEIMQKDTIQKSDN